MFESHTALQFLKFKLFNVFFKTSKKKKQNDRKLQKICDNDNNNKN